MSLVGTVIINWDAKGEKAGWKFARRQWRYRISSWGHRLWFHKNAQVFACTRSSLSEKAQCLVMSEVTDGGFKGLKDTSQTSLCRFRQRQSAMSGSLIWITHYFLYRHPNNSWFSSDVDVPEGYAYIQDISAIAATSSSLTCFGKLKQRSALWISPAISFRTAAGPDSVIWKSEQAVKAAYELTRSQVGNSSDVITHGMIAD